MIAINYWNLFLIITGLVGLGFIAWYVREYLAFKNDPTNADYFREVRRMVTYRYSLKEINEYSEQYFTRKKSE